MQFPVEPPLTLPKESCTFSAQSSCGGNNPLWPGKPSISPTNHKTISRLVFSSNLHSHKMLLSLGYVEFLPLTRIPICSKNEGSSNYFQNSTVLHRQSKQENWTFALLSPTSAPGNEWMLFLLTRLEFYLLRWRNGKEFICSSIRHVWYNSCK